MAYSSTPSPFFPPASLPCQRDGNSENALPAICNHIFTEYISKLAENTKNISTAATDSELMTINMFVEILKYLGLFVVVLASLAFLTLLLCYRRKAEVCTAWEYLASQIILHCRTRLLLLLKSSLFILHKDNKLVPPKREIFGLSFSSALDVFGTFPNIAL